MKKYEEIVMTEKPGAVIVVGESGRTPRSLLPWRRAQTSLLEQAEKVFEPRFGPNLREKRT